MFIVVIAVIFGCNVFYLMSLYGSIRETVEKDVMTALADADLDELWVRSERASNEARAQIASGEREEYRQGEISAGMHEGGTLKTTTTYADGTVAEDSLPIQEESFNNMFAQIVGRQFHSIIDPYLEVNLGVMDSLLTRQLNARYIYPDFVATEIIGPDGQIVQHNNEFKTGDYDEFTYCFNPEKGLAYRLYITPLTKHIFSEMSGVIVTVFLLMISFGAAFWYLLHTVSRLRTLEEMKDDFVSNMTHELKTPIAIAYSANDALLNYDADRDPAKKEQYLRIANRQLRRLGELVENILATSMERQRTMRLNPETVRLHPFIREIAASQQMRDDKRIAIAVEGTEDISVEADRSHLANVLNNLIDNAIKYSDDSVKITVKYDNEKISVTDNGIGIPPKAIPYLFNRFYRVPHGDRQDVRGHGIGLYYVKSVLDRMGWSIRVKSKEGEGSRFTIFFRNYGQTIQE